jgi:transcriptional regulator with XRE-family HTH domain
MAYLSLADYAGRMARTRKPSPVPVPPDEPHHFAHLAAWRDFAGLTQEQVANIFLVSDVTIHRWETGKAPVTVENLFKLAEIYGAKQVGELTFAPTHRHLAEDAKKALNLISNLPESDRKQWLAIGQTLDDARRRQK